MGLDFVLKDYVTLLKNLSRHISGDTLAKDALQNFYEGNWIC